MVTLRDGIPTRNITLIALLDSGGSATLVRSNFVTNHTQYQAKRELTWNTPGGTLMTKTKACATLTFPECNPNWLVNWSLHVSPDLGAYDMIIGRDLLQSLGIDIWFSDQTIRWDNGSKMDFRSLEQCRSGRQVRSLEKTLEEEIKHLRQQGILQEDSPDKWQAALFNVPIREHSPRRVYTTRSNIQQDVLPTQTDRTTIGTASASSTRHQQRSTLQSPSRWRYNPTPMGLRTSPSVFQRTAGIIASSSEDDEQTTTHRVPATAGTIEINGHATTVIRPRPPAHPPWEHSTTAAELWAIDETAVRLKHLTRQTRKPRPKKTAKRKHNRPNGPR